jgi:TolB-like protein
MLLTPGGRLGAYEIVGVLGAGGMGEVYRARDPRLDRHVAIKVLAPALAADAAWLVRFEREARVVASLSHPNIVVIHSVEQADGVRFLTMELVPGESLQRRVRPGGLDLEQVLALAIPLADALAAAHARGVVHRDLKPGNVMVGPDGRVKVLDFGLAKPVEGPDAADGRTHTAASPVSTPGELMGTMPYMSPEQLRGAAIDARTDIFAFGILLFELITGRRPFSGESSADLMSAILRDAPPSMQALRPGLPPDLVRIVGRCLEKDPERRLQTAKDLRNELEWIRRNLEPAGLPTVRLAAEAPAPARGTPSIAVLPFENRNRDEADAYFADGITEDVIAQLCKVRTLKVISWTSVMPFRQRDQSLREIASTLQVAHVLEGSVRRIGDRVRIVAQLIEAGSGQHLWADTYDRQLTDIFAIQSDVALHIVAALEAELTSKEQSRIRARPTADVQAYEYYLRGRHALIRWTMGDIQRSLEHFAAAVSRDPDFALAHTGIAMAYTELGELGVLTRQQAAAPALSAARRAVALNPDLAEAHCANAFARLVFEFDWEGAEAGFRRAIDLNPSYADAYDLCGRMCASLERHEEAIALQQRAHELDPLTHRVDLATALLRAGRAADAERAALAVMAVEPNDARLQATLGWARIRQGRAADGLAALEQAVALAPGEDMWRAQLGQAFALAGRTEEARAVLRMLENPSRPSPASAYHLAYVYTGLGEADRAMDLLERAYDERAGALYGIKGSFLFAPLRQHPRFMALLRRLRLDPA